MEVEFDESLAAEQLYSAMRVSDSVLHSRGRVEEMLRDRSMTNRAFAVDWMKKVRAGPLSLSRSLVLIIMFCAGLAWSPR